MAGVATFTKGRGLTIGEGGPGIMTGEGFGFGAGIRDSFDWVAVGLGDGLGTPIIILPSCGRV